MDRLVLAETLSSYHNDSRLIVGQHNRDETSVGAHSGNDILHLDPGCHLRDGHKSHVYGKKQKPKRVIKGKEPTLGYANLDLFKGTFCNCPPQN